MTPKFQLTAAVLVVLVPACARPPATSTLALTNVTVVNVRDGSRISDATVVIENGTIVGVGTSDVVRTPRQAKVVAARGKFVIPG